MTLGQLFQSKRSELGRSLEQISASTKIHTKILRALEEDQYSELPARAFTRGFIVTYCKALKLDSEQVLKEYHDFLESKFNERQDRDQGHQGYVFEGKELEQNKRWMVIGASIAALFAIAVLVIFKPQNHHRNEKHKEFVEEPSPTPQDLADVPNVDDDELAAVAQNAPNATQAASTPMASAPATSSPTVSPTPSVSASPAVSPTPSASPTPKEDKLNKGDDLNSKDVKRRILFQANDDVWVRYQVDGKPVMAFVLRKGRQLVIKAKDQLRFETNNNSALQYKSRGSQYLSLDQSSFSVEPDGSLKSISAGSIAPIALPSAIPASPNATPNE